MNENESKKKSNIGYVFIIIATILIVIILLCSGTVIYFNYKTKEEDTKIQQISMQNSSALLEMNEKIEYGTEITYEDILAKIIDKNKLYDGTQIKIYLNDKEIMQGEKYKFDEVGTYKVKVEIEKTYVYKVLKDETEVIRNEKEGNIIVEDTKFPILEGIQDKEITVGDNINILEGITAKDEVDGNLELIQEGELDTSKAGEYVIKIKAKDKNENETAKEMKVTVKEKEVEAPKPTTNNNSESTSNKNSSSKSTGSSSNKGTSTNKNTNASAPSSSSSKTSTSSSSNASSSSETGTSSNSSANSSASSSQSSGQSSNSSSTSSSNDASTKNGRLNIAKAEAKKIVSKITKAEMSDYEKADAICQYLFNNVERQTDQSTESYKTNFGNEAYAALVLKKAACSGFCKAVTLMCDAAGLKSQHINANQWTHQWNKVYINGEWIVLDAQIRFIRRN